MRLTFLDEQFKQAGNLCVLPARIAALFLARLHPVRVAALGADGGAGFKRPTHVCRQAQKVSDGFGEGLIARALPPNKCFQQMLRDTRLSL